MKDLHMVQDKCQSYDIQIHCVVLSYSVAHTCALRAMRTVACSWQRGDCEYASQPPSPTCKKELSII